MEILDALKKAIELQKELIALIQKSDIIGVEPWAIQVKSGAFLRTFGPLNETTVGSGNKHYEAPFGDTCVVACALPEEGVSLEEIDP